MTRIADPTTLQIIHYPHPTLRRKSKPVKRVDAALRQTVRRMFELMYEARGIGLAANQVDLSLRLFIVNLSGEPEQGEELVFINPVLSRPKGVDEASEGCLSLPELYGNVTRPKRIRVTAFSLDGQAIDEELDGLLSRVVQHETDHLDGILFTDRMSHTGRLTVAEALEEFEVNFANRRQLGEIPGDGEIESRLQQWESRYC